MSRRRAAALVLAAGAGRRFGGRKLLALLDGRPLLQHVLDTCAGAGLGPVIVVLGRDAPELEAVIAWRSETRVVNPHPARGIAGSLLIGLDALAGAAADRALVLLGDQPRLQAAQIEQLLAVPHDPHRPIVVPRYDDGRPGNPVLLEREAWDLAANLAGDRGMAQLFGTHAGLVRYVALAGTNPDVDTPADLAALSRGAGRALSGRTAVADRSRPSPARRRRT